MTDLRLELAQEIADQIGAVLYMGRCHCGWPLMRFRNEPVAFGWCWECQCTEIFVTKTRALLERIQCRGHYYHIGDETYYCEKEGCCHAA
jgi:hypothetical protein